MKGILPIAECFPPIEEQIRALPPDSLFEIVAGQVVIAEPMGVLGSIIASTLSYFLNRFAQPRHQGIALIEGLFGLGDGLPQRRPDVAFVPADQWPANWRPDEDPISLRATPSLVVEVISPCTVATLIEQKRIEYFRAGVKTVWVVHPIPQTIQVFDSPNTGPVVSKSDVLDGGIAIPGFQVNVADIFACMFPGTVGAESAKE